MKNIGISPKKLYQLSSTCHVATSNTNGV